MLTIRKVWGNLEWRVGIRLWKQCFCEWGCLKVNSISHGHSLFISSVRVWIENRKEWSDWVNMQTFYSVYTSFDVERRMLMLDWSFPSRFQFCSVFHAFVCLLSAYVSIFVALCACHLMRTCVYSQVLRTRLQAPALTMTTAGIWTRTKSGSKSNSFCHREDTTAPGSNSTPCLRRYTSPLPISALLYGWNLMID